MKPSNGNNGNNLSLIDLANAIAQQQGVANSLESLIVVYRESKSRIELDAELTSAFDPELTNADRRKAARRDILANDANYQRTVSKLDETDVKCKSATCELERLRRLYRAFELEKLEQIVEKGASNPLLK